MALGGAGGALFFWIGTPLPWMMGAMCATTIAAIAGLRIRASKTLRNGFIMVLGVLLGSTFSPAMIDAVGQWTASLAAMAGYVSVVGLGLCALLLRISSYDRPTAYFSAAPGGLNEMIIVGGAMGGDDRVISLIHSARVLFVVFSLPFFFSYGQSALPGAGGHGGLDWADIALLCAAAVIGFPVAYLARIPAAQLIGPMLFSAAIHLAGWTAAGPPAELVAVAQVVIGSTIGSRFTGMDWHAMLRPVGYALILTVIMVAASAGLALALHGAIGVPFDALWLAFSPGGLAEMSLIALALHLDPAFVATHHVFRILLVVILAPLAYRLFIRKKTS
ncbi:MAG: AbrB family transcriptional regulator [Alphaproteobacteria bacterium]